MHPLVFNSILDPTIISLGDQHCYWM